MDKEHSAIISKIFTLISEDKNLALKYNVKVIDSDIVIERDDERYPIETFYDTMSLMGVLQELKEKFPINVYDKDKKFIVTINKSEYRKYIIRELIKKEVD